jgi:protein-S-isoprenylcysteine O-methyltransferase Ste14
MSQGNTVAMFSSLARWRVPIGFVLAAIVLWLARPTPQSVVIGGLITVPGELLRLWAAGHIDKGREVTRSGPYRWVRHPLYLGSTVMGVGFAVAAARLVPALMVGTYLVVAFGVAIRTEEAALGARFGGEYAAYRAGVSAPVARPWRLDRVIANREYRAAAGLALALALLVLRMSFMP